MWFLSPSGWPTVATDGSLFAQSLFDRGWTVMDAAEVQAAIDAYLAGEVFVPTPPDYVDDDELAAAIAGAIVTVPDATSTVRGKVRLGGDLAGTADDPTVPGLAGKVDTATFTAAMGNKVDLSSLTAALATKANVTDMPAALAVNVRDFGATGDGTTDDQPALQAALNAARDAGGGVVLIPAGTYAVAAYSTVYSGTTVMAYGATIRATGNTGILRNFDPGDSFAGYAGRSYITVLGGIWDGNAAGSGGGTVTALNNILYFVHARSITVRDAELRNCSSAHAVEFNSIDGGRVLNCRFLGFADNTGDSGRQFSEAIQIDMAIAGSLGIGVYDNTPSRNIVVDGCYCGPSDRLGPWGRFVGSHSSSPGVYFDDITVVNNRVEGTIQQGVHGLGWRRPVIANNTITGAGIDGIRVQACVSPVMSGNLIENAGSSGIFATECASPLLSGNAVIASESNAYNVAGSTDATIVGNSVDGTNSNYGVFVGPSTGGVNAVNAVVQNNHIRNPAVGGIRLAASATGCFVSGNRVRKAGGPATTGVLMTGSATGCVVVGNDFSGNSWTAANAVTVSTSAAKTDYAGGTAVPGHNLI